MARNGMLIIDADGHVSEPVQKIRKLMSEEYQRRPISEGESWDRSFGGTLGKNNDDPRVQLTDMDTEGIDVQVIFPSSAISLSHMRERPLAVERARAYNDWLAEFCSTNPDRLKGVGVVAVQDLQSAIREARRAVEELGFVAVMMPTNVLDQDIGRQEFWPLYEEVQGLGVPLAVHGGIHASERFTARFDTFIAVHTVAFPMECMVSTVGLVFAGVPEQFPTLKIGILEGNCGWLPFLMDRMDEEFEKRGWKEAPLLKRKPSEYLTSGQFSYGFEIEESTLPYVIERIGVDKLLWASDYPHWDGPFPHAVDEFVERTDLTDEQKRIILGENPQRFYGLKVAEPAGVA
jgi:predicted TIM-barrel fold metal-dependent hydrolase